MKSSTGRDGKWLLEDADWELWGNSRKLGKKAPSRLHRLAIERRLSHGMRLLRIADVTDNRSGGMSRTMYGTGDELVRLGHRVEYWFEDRLSVGVRPQLRRFVVPWRIVRQVRAALARGEFYDVVEIHEPLGGYFAWHRRSLPPLAIFSYGLEDRSRNAALAYRRQKGLPVSLKQRYSPLSVVWQACYATRHAAHVVCSNSEDVNHLHSRGVPLERLTRHHSGVEPEFLAAGATPDSAASRSGILFLGSWLLRKGILDLVIAVSAVMRRRPEVRLTVAGCGVDESVVLADFDPALRSQIRVLPSVQGNERLIRLYREHAIFVLPSYFEGQPLVMIEAAALGMGILTTNVCGMRDFVRDGESGFLVGVGDAAALTERLDRMVADPDLVQRLGRAARERAETHTWETAARKIDSAYRTLVRAGD